MSEVWSVLIGTISGFIIAFFAEPVKTYFRNKNEIKALKSCLYKELVVSIEMTRRILDWLTYRATHNKVDNDPIEDETIAQIGSQAFIKLSCYQQAISNPQLFYQLEEAAQILLIYQALDLVQRLFLQFSNKFHEEKNDISELTEMADDLQTQFEKLPDKKLINKIRKDTDIALRPW